MGLEFRFRKHHVFDGQLEIHIMSPHELPKASHIRELLMQRSCSAVSRLKRKSLLAELSDLVMYCRNSVGRNERGRWMQLSSEATE